MYSSYLVNFHNLSPEKVFVFGGKRFLENFGLKLRLEWNLLICLEVINSERK